jgi:2,6-dihydroxypyridine 3-monooxygenase
VPEARLSAETLALLGDSLGYWFGPDSHICMYPIPGPDGAIARGQRLMNYVWYRNIADPVVLDEVMTDKSGFRAEVSVHPGRVQDRFVDEMKEAAGGLPQAACELVRATEHPYIQPILDVRVPRLAFGRAVLLGDAGFVARPHAAAGTAKAAAEAWALAEAIEKSNGDLNTALAAWEPQQLAVGNALIDRVVQMGERAQFKNSWTPHDPDLRFGLTGGALRPAY